MNYKDSLIYRYTNKYFKKNLHNEKVIALLVFTIFVVCGLIIGFCSQVDQNETRYINTQLKPENSVTDQLETNNEPLTQEMLARVTCYVWTGNKMANGKYPKKGYIATSDRSIPFGTKIEIDEVEYEVGDRTNYRFQYFKVPTIDIFWEESRESCLEFGVKYKKIIIKL